MKIKLIILFLLSPFIFKAQTNQYLYARKTGESVESFVERHLKGKTEGMDETHSVVEAFWGDETKGKKITCFYASPHSIEIKMVTFQPIGDSINYIMIENKSYTIGRYHNSIISVFFMDIDSNGTKELCFIEKAEVRVPVTLEDVNENGEIIKYQTTACCKEVYGTKVYIEDIKKDIYTSKIRESKFSVIPEFDGLQTAREVKQKVAEINKGG